MRSPRTVDPLRSSPSVGSSLARKRPLTSMPRPLAALIILNPAAGRWRARRFAARMLRAARVLKWDVDLRLTRHAGDEVSLAAAARSEAWPLVIAAGGDGTVHGVANGLLADGDTDIVLGHVPIGNGNDFAHTIGLPGGAPERTLTMLQHGVVRRIDIGHALGELFVNGLGVGFSAEVVRRLLRFKHLRGFPLYLAAAFRTFTTFDPPELEVCADEHTERGPMMMVEVTNGPTAGGGFRLTPDAVPSDGVFDVCLIRQVGLSKFLRSLPSVVRGTHGRLPDVTIFRTALLRIASGAHAMTLHMDGELRQNVAGPVEIRLEAQRLQVLCAPS